MLRQRGLFQPDAEEKAPAAVTPPAPLRECGRCAENVTPADRRYAALGLMQCKLEPDWTYRSTVNWLGMPRRCDKGLTDADPRN